MYRRPGPGIGGAKQARRERDGGEEQDSEGILGKDQTDQREHVVELLTKAYWMEIETVMSYIAASVNLDGVRAQRDQGVARRATSRRSSATPAASPSGSRSSTASCRGREDFSAEQTFLQPPDEQTDIVHVIQGVIEAETGAIEHYTRIIEETEGVDPVTQDMVIEILRDEQGHRRLFEGFLREFEKS